MVLLFWYCGIGRCRQNEAQAASLRYERVNVDNWKLKMTRNWFLVMIHLSIDIILHHRLVLPRLRHKAKFIVEDSLNSRCNS